MNIMVARQTPPIDYSGVPFAFHGKVSAVCHSLTECEDLAKWFGHDDFCPFLPILILIPGVPIQQLAGWALAPAAELRDMAIAIWAIQTKRMAKSGRIVDFDALREKHGLMRREDIGPAMSEALSERIRRHKANPITDPPRERRYPRINGKVVFGIDGFKVGASQKA